MKRLRMAIVALAVLVGVVCFLVSPSKTYAGSTGGSNCTSSGTITCVILVVKLSASSGSVPSSDITVKATRKVQPTGWADNSFTLDKKSDTLFSSTKGVYGVKPSYWAAQTSCANPTGIAASGATNTDVATYNIAVTQGGKTIGTTTGVNLCSGTSLSNAFEATKTVSVTVTPSGQAATKGGIKGTATWQDPLTNDTGTCSAASFVDINGGPDKLSGGKQVQVEIGAGGAFSTNSNQLTPGGDYSVSVTCYDKGDPNESNVYGAVKTNVTVKAGQFVTVAFDKIQPTNAGGSTTPPNPKSSNDSDSLDCGAGDWNWLVCSGISMLQGAATTMNNIINHYLTVDTSEIFSGTGGQDAYHAAWNSFRILAIAVLLIAGLVMVASEALGLEILDAYTIRKTLPRLLVGAIGISVSWPLMQFVIDFFNAFGKDIMNLISVPFNTLENHQEATIITMANPLSVFLVVGGALWVFGPAALTFILTAFLAIILAIFILVIRQAAIIVLVILAPLAIACYILPNTQKIWKMWYDNFLGLMIMYPIIMAFIAGGRVMAAAASSHKSDPFYGILAVIAYFIPYFLLPLAFRMATGAIGTIAGMVNDRNKGAFDRLKNMRAAGRATQHQRRMDGEISKGLGGNMYRRAVHGFTTPNTGAFSLTKSGRSKYRSFSERHGTATSGALLKEAGVTEAMQDDDVRVALMSGSAGAAQGMLSRMGRSQEQIRSTLGMANSIGFSERAGLAALQIESTMGKGRGLSAMATANGVDDSTQMNNLVNSVGHGLDDAGRERLRQTTMYNFGGAGRGDLRQGSVGDVLDKKFDTQIAATATEGAMDSLAGEMVTRFHTGSQDQKVQAAAQLLATEESRSRMSEPTRQKLTEKTDVAGLNGSAHVIDRNSAQPIEIQLASQLVAPAQKTAYDTAQSNYDAAQTALRTAQAGGATGAALIPYRDAAGQARASLELVQKPIMDIAQQIRSTSSTYSSSVPYGARENP